MTAKSCVSRDGATRGQSSVEFAIVATMFLLLMFAVMDYAWIMFAQMNVQQAVDDGGRFASTGNHSTVTTGGTVTTLSRMQSIIQTIQNEISIPNINVQSNLVVCSLDGGCSNTGGSTPAGGPGDTVTLTLTTTLPMLAPLNFVGPLFGNGQFSVFSSGYTFTASTTFKNEPFNPSNSN